MTTVRPAVYCAIHNAEHRPCDPGRSDETPHARHLREMRADRPEDDAMTKAVMDLERRHGCLVTSQRGEERFTTMINTRTMKTAAMVVVKLAIPMASPLGKRIARDYAAHDKRGRKAARRG